MPTYTLARRQRIHRDAESPLWAGCSEAFQAARFGYWLHDDAMATPAVRTLARIRLIKLTGIVTRTSWEWLEEAILETPIGCPMLVLSIASRAQQVWGFQGAVDALRAVSLRVTTVAHYEAAGGLAVSLGQACHHVTARASSPIGWMWIFSPFGEPTPGNFLPCHDGRPRGFSPEVNRRLKHGALNGEALEGRGVNWLSAGCWASATKLVEMLNGGSDA